KLMNKCMQCCKATLDKGFNSGVACKCYIIIQAEKRQNIPIENMSRRRNCHLFKENTIITNKYADPAILNIQFKRADSAARHLQKDLLVCQLIRSHQYRDAIPLRQSRQPRFQGIITG